MSSRDSEREQVSPSAHSLAQDRDSAMIGAGFVDVRFWRCCRWSFSPTFHCSERGRRRMYAAGDDRLRLIAINVERHLAKEAVDIAWTMRVSHADDASRDAGQTTGYGPG